MRVFKKLIKFTLVLFLLGIVCVAALIFFCPPQLIEITANKALHRFGLSNAKFTVEKINLPRLYMQGAQLNTGVVSLSVDDTRIKLADEKFLADNIALNYGFFQASMEKLAVPFALQKQLSLGDITADSIKFADVKIANLSLADDLENITINDITNRSVNIPQIQITLDKLNGFSLSNFQNISLQNIGLQNLNIHTPKIKSGALTYNAKQASVTNNFSDMALKNLQIKSPTLLVTAGALNITAPALIGNFAEVLGKIQSFNWRGNWRLKKINATSGDFVMPEISGGGVFTVKNSKVINIIGKAASTDKTINADFAFSHVLPNTSVLRLDEIAYSFAGGTLSSSNIVVPLNKKAELDFTVQVKDIKANEILHKLLGDKFTISGNLSGSLPIKVTPNFAEIFIKDGTLYATEAGVLSLAPEFVPGDNPAVALVQKVVQNFHFSRLTFFVNTGEDGRLVVSMNIVGNNPDVENGRPVNMNVNLGGDILSLVQQNIMLYKEPAKLLQTTK